MNKINIPNLGIFLIKESSAVPSSESELCEMTIGNLARVTHIKPYRNLEVYEGEIDGKYSFMFQDSQDPIRINSFRIAKEKIKFDPYYGAFLKEKDTEFVQYKPEDKEYETKKQILIKARDWREIKN